MDTNTQAADLITAEPNADAGLARLAMAAKEINGLELASIDLTSLDRDDLPKSIPVGIRYGDKPELVSIEKFAAEGIACKIQNAMDEVRSAADRRSKSRSWSGIQWKVAVDRIASK